MYWDVWNSSRFRIQGGCHPKPQDLAAWNYYSSITIHPEPALHNMLIILTVLIVLMTTLSVNGTWPIFQSNYFTLSKCEWCIVHVHIAISYLQLAWHQTPLFLVIKMHGGYLHCCVLLWSCFTTTYNTWLVNIGLMCSTVLCCILQLVHVNYIINIILFTYWDQTLGHVSIYIIACAFRIALDSWPFKYNQYISELHLVDFCVPLLPAHKLFTIHSKLS